MTFSRRRGTRISEEVGGVSFSSQLAADTIIFCIISTGKMPMRLGLQISTNRMPFPMLSILSQTEFHGSARYDPSVLSRALA